MGKLERVINRLEDFMIYAIMILAFLNYTSITQNTSVVSVFIWPTVFLSGICILYRIFKYKNYQINGLFKYLVLFLISYAISSLLNIKYGYYQNFRTLILMTILIGLVYTKSKNNEDKYKIIEKYSKAFVIITTFLSFITLLIFNINQIFVNIGSESIYITGLRWGRLKGAYNDFNYGGIINALAMVMLLYFFITKKSKKQRILCLISMIINFSFISLSDSRTSLLALIAAVLVFIFGYVFRTDKKMYAKIIKFITVTVVTVCIIFAGKIGIKKIFTKIYDNEEEQITIDIGNGISINKEKQNEKTNGIPDDELDGTNEDKKENIYNRGNYEKSDISNRRYDLWRSSAEIFEKNMFFGVSFENLESYCHTELPDTYLIDNGYKEFDNFHNLIFNVLASQGIIGISILLIIALYLFIYIIKYLILLINSEDYIKKALVLSCIIVGIVSTMLIGDIVYYISPSTVTFWFFLGYLINDVDSIREKRASILIKAVKKARRIFLVKIFNLFPIKREKIIFSNFNGKGYGDNPKYILEEINNRKLNYDLVWVLKDISSKSTLPDNVRYVKYNSLKYFYNICTAKVWIDNHRKIIDLEKRKDQFYIQTWHGGIALKKIEKDALESLDPKYIKQAKHDSSMIDLMISNSGFCTKMYKEAFWYDGEILEAGSPRNDALLNNNLSKEKIYKNLKIEKNKKILMYAPTFRKDESLENYNIDFKELIDILEKETKEEWIVLIRLHPNIADKSKELIKGMSGKVIDTSNYGDMYELMQIADTLITDYSSVMFEFSFTEKPVFLYANDISKYIEDRGFYFEYRELPYSIAENNEELRTNILNFKDEEYKAKLHTFFEKLHLFEGGDASKKVVDVIEREVKSK